MDMPILPSLMGTNDPAAPPPATLVDIISQLDELQVGELLTAADAAGFGVEPVEPVEGDEPVDGEEPEAEMVEEETPEEEEVAETEEEPGEEVPAEGDDAEVPEEEVTEMAELGFDAIGTWADTALEQIDAQYDALVELGKAADADLGADPDAIAALVEQADTLREQASEARDNSAAAAKSEDARTCALEALKLERASRVLAKLLEQAQAYAETTDTPEAGPADDPAMKLWAERTAPKTGMLPL